MNNYLILIRNTVLLQMKNSFARPMFKFCLIFQPVIYCFITYMMYKQSSSQNFTSFVVLGSGLLSLWSCICFSSMGDLERERYMGTLEIIYGTPTSFKLIVFGKILGNTLLGMTPLLISFILAFCFIQEPLDIKSPPLFVFSFLIAIIAFICISFMFMAVFTISRSAGVLMNCLEYPIFFICGFIVPIDYLPNILKSMSMLFSPTWVMQLLRTSIEGEKSSSYYMECLIITCLISIVYLLISSFLFRKMDKMIRISGSLGVK